MILTYKTMEEARSTALGPEGSWKGLLSWPAASQPAGWCVGGLVYDALEAITSPVFV